MHSYYELGRHEQGKPLNVGNGQYPRPANVPKLNENPLRNKARNSDKSDLLALLWVSAYEKLLDQLPAGTSRLLVEGAMSQAYQVSRLLTDSPRAEGL